MKKNDLFILAAVVLLAVIGVIAVLLLFGGDNSDTAVVFVDGKEIARLPVDTDTEYRIESDSGYNILVIKDQKVYMREASCPNRDCVRHGPLYDISPIVCSPNKVVVTLEEG